MNGRLYDPVLGRFLSPDPIVQFPGYSQSWNRYSYVFNSPASFTDPSGFYCDGCIHLDPTAEPPGDYHITDRADSGGPGQNHQKEPDPVNNEIYPDTCLGGTADACHNAAAPVPPMALALDRIWQRVANAIIKGSFETDAENDAWGTGLIEARERGPEAEAQYIREHPRFGATEAILGALAGGNALAARSSAPLAKIFEGHGAGQGFTGVFDASTGRIALRPSTADAVIPEGWVARTGGHAAVSAELGTNTAGHAGFAVIIEDGGGLRLTWRSGTLNAAPGYVVPEAMRPTVVRAVEQATGRTVTSW